MAEFDQINQLLNNLDRLQKELEQTPEAAARFARAMEVIRQAYSLALNEIGPTGDAEEVRQAFTLLAHTADAFGKAGSEAGRLVVAGLRDTLGEINKVIRAYEQFTPRAAPTATPQVAEQEIFSDREPVIQKIEQHSEALDKNTQKVRENAAAMSDAVEFTEEQQKSYDSITATLERSGVSIEQFNAVIATTGKTLEELVATGAIKFTTDVNSGISEATIKVREADGSFKQLRVTLDGLGGAATVSMGRFRQLGNMITRNITEVAKWSLSVGVVYGTMSQLNQAVSTAISNQTKLAEIQTVLGDSSRSLNGVFQSALDVARTTGSSVQGVLDSYTEAIRVTANISNETERFASANKLLRDSLVLSKLGAFEQAEAMDLLIATLNQLNVPLNEGSVILDKWVATSRIAGVSLKDLATAYSITAGAAEIAGIKVGGLDDELSGLIASIAEKFPYEGRELGNRIRALVAGFGDTSRQQRLFELGVSPLDAQGELRPYKEIMKELNELYRQGILNEKQLGDIAGQNARERNIFIEAIKSYTRSVQISEQATNSAGAAERALAVQLETVETSIRRLENAFASFAQTLGSDGGVLEAIGRLVDFTTSLVEALDGVVGATGRAGPALAALFGANYLAGRVLGVAGGPLGAISRRVGGGTTGITGPPGQMVLPGMGPSGLTGRQFLGNAAAGAVGVVISQALRDEVDWGSAGAGIVGALLGAFAGPGGSLIGAMLAQGIVEGLAKQEQAVDNFGANAAAAFYAHFSKQELDANTDPLEESIYESAQKALNKAILESSTGLSRSVVGGMVGFLQRSESIFQWLGVSTPEVSIVVQLAEAEGLNPELVQALLDDGKVTEVKFALAAVSGAGPDIVNKYLQDVADLSEELAKADKAQDDLIASIGQMRPTNFDELVQARREAFVADPSDFQGYLDAISQIESAIHRARPLLENYGDDLREAFGFTNNQQLQDFLVGKLYDMPEPLAQQVQSLAIRDADMSDADAKKNADEIIFILQTYVSQDPIEVPVTIDASGIEDADMLNEVFALADRLALSYAEGLAQSLVREKGIVISEARIMAHEIVDAQREIVLLRAGEVYAPFEIAGRDYFNTAQQMLQQQRQSARGGARTSVGFQDIDLPSSAWGQIQSTINYFSTQLGRLGYQENRTPQVIRFADNIIQVKDVDSQLLQLALNELIDVNRDQLEGIYNLPTDASFYVPFTGYQLGFGGESGGGMGPLPIIDIEGSDMIKSAADGMLSAADLMNQAALLMSQSQQQGKPLPDWNPSGAQAPLTYNVQAIQSLANLPSAIQTGIGKAVAGVTSQINSGMDERRFREGQYGALYEAQRYDPSTQQLSAAVNFLGNSVNALSFNLTDLFSTLKALKEQVPPVDLRLQIQSNNMLNLDGRVIAASVSNHIAQSLVRFGGSQGGASVRFII